VLQLLAKRSLNEGKATAYESVGAMQRQWTPLQLGQAQTDEDEIVQLNRALQQASVAATIAHLRRRVPAQRQDSASTAFTIACLDGGAVNQAAAVLVAAAMQPEAAAGHAAQVSDGGVQAAEAGTTAAGTSTAAGQEVAAAVEAARVALAGAALQRAAADSAADSGLCSGSPRKKMKSEPAAGDAGAGSSGGGGSEPGAAGGQGGGGFGEGGGGSAAGSSEPDAHGPVLLLGESRVDVSSMMRVLALLDAIFTRDRANAPAAPEDDAPATTKTVQNLIDRHVGPGDKLLLFTSSDIKLEARILARLQAQGSGVHAHINNETLGRMEREGAKAHILKCLRCRGVVWKR